MSVDQAEHQRVLDERNQVNEYYIQEGQKRRAAEERVRVLEAAIKVKISECDECGGQGFNVCDDGDGDIDKDPCNSCWDLRELVQDHTDYVMERTVAAAPQPEAGTPCPDWCVLGKGHTGGHDDGIPF